MTFKNFSTNGRSTYGRNNSLPTTGRFEGDSYLTNDFAPIIYRWFDNSWRMASMSLPPNHLYVDAAIVADNEFFFNTLDAALTFITGQPGVGVYTILINNAVTLTSSFNMLTAADYIRVIGVGTMPRIIVGGLPVLGNAITFQTATTTLIGRFVFEKIALTNAAAGVIHTTAPLPSGDLLFEDVLFEFSLAGGIYIINDIVSTACTLNNCRGPFSAVLPRITILGGNLSNVYIRVNINGTRISHAVLGSSDSRTGPVVEFAQPANGYNEIVGSRIGHTTGVSVANAIQNTGVALTNQNISYNFIETGIDGTIGLATGATNVIF